MCVPLRIISSDLFQTIKFWYSLCSVKPIVGYFCERFMVFIGEGKFFLDFFLCGKEWSQCVNNNNRVSNTTLEKFWTKKLDFFVIVSEKSKSSSINYHTIKFHKFPILSYSIPNYLRYFGFIYFRHSLDV